MMAKRLILCCLAVAGVVMLRAQDFDKRDSLLAVFEAMPRDTVRLKALFDVTLDLCVSDPDRCAVYNDLLIEQAAQQQNTYYLANAYFSQIVMAYNLYDVKTIEKTIELLEPVARKGKHYDLLFRAWRCKIDLKLLSRDYERGENEARIMLREAEKLDNLVGKVEGYQCLANIYRATFRKEQAIELLEETLPEARRIGRSGTILNVLQNLCFLYQEIGGKKNYAGWHRALIAFEKELLAVNLQTPDPAFLILYGNYIDYYLWQNKLKEAGEILEHADHQYYTHINAPLSRFYYNEICMRYLTRIGEYDRALVRADAALADMRIMNIGPDYMNMLYKKADLLNKAGYYEEAMPIYKQTLDYKDSMQVATINKQYEQLRKNFNSDQLQLEQARIQYGMQLSMLILLGLGMLVVVYFVIYQLRARRTLSRAEQEMRGMAHQMELVGEAKDRFLSNISATIRMPLNIVVDGSMRLATHQVEDTEEQRQLSDSIRTMSNDLLKVINDILDLSRLEAGMMKFDITDVEITSLIFDASASVQPAPEMRIEYPEDVLYTVRFDAMRLRQLLGALFEMPDREGGLILAMIRVEESLLTLTVCHTALARENATQEIIIRNEINRMLVQQFGGTYQIDSTFGQERVVLILPVKILQFE